MNLKKTTILLKIFCVFTIILSLFDEYFERTTEGIPPYITYPLLVVNFSWMIIIGWESGFFRTVYFRIMLAFMCILLFGAMTKVMHWAFPSFISLIGLAGSMITYLIRFVFKKKKAFLDVAKLVWLEMAFITVLMRLLDGSDRGYSSINTMTFLLMICIFAFTYEPGKKQKEQKELDEWIENLSV